MQIEFQCIQPCHSRIIVHQFYNGNFADRITQVKLSKLQL